MFPAPQLKSGMHGMIKHTQISVFVHFYDNRAHFAIVIVEKLIFFRFSGENRLTRAIACFDEKNNNAGFLVLLLILILSMRDRNRASIMVSTYATKISSIAI